MQAQRKQSSDLSVPPSGSWFQRIGACDLSLADLARLTGRSLISLRTLVLKADERPPYPVVAAITAWELMSSTQRKKWLAAVERATD